MITTARLFVRPFIIEDAQAFFDLTRDKGFTAFAITNYKQTNLESARQWIMTKSNGKFGVWEGENLIGMGGLTNWEWEGEKLVDITYRFRESAWGKGYGTELAQALVEYGVKDLKLKQITATITPDNLGSKKIAEKLGMKVDKNILLLGVPTELYRLRV